MGPGDSSCSHTCFCLQHQSSESPLSLECQQHLVHVGIFSNDSDFFTIDNICVSKLFYLLSLPLSSTTLSHYLIGQSWPGNVKVLALAAWIPGGEALSTPFLLLGVLLWMLADASCTPCPLGVIQCLSSLMLQALYIYLTHLHSLGCGEETGIITAILQIEKLGRRAGTACR